MQTGRCDVERIGVGPIDGLGPPRSWGRAEEVVQRISESISLGLLVDGEQLPSETDLSAMLGVSTVTLREALASLRQQGLIETRRGRNGGSFVRSAAGPTKAALERRLAAFTVSQLRDAGDELTAISGAAARLASSRASTTVFAGFRCWRSVC